MREEDYQNDERQTDADVETGVKKFIEEFTIDDSTKTLRPPETTETEILEEPNPYHCSECNIHFPSVQEHINNCHKGQDVVFQVGFFKNKSFVYQLSLNILYV